MLRRHRDAVRERDDDRFADVDAQRQAVGENVPAVDWWSWSMIGFPTRPGSRDVVREDGVADNRKVAVSASTNWSWKVKLSCSGGVATADALSASDAAAAQQRRATYAW